MLIREYTKSFQRNFSEQKSDDLYNKKMIEARLLGLEIQRKYINGLLSSGEINYTEFDILTKFLDYREETIDSDFSLRPILFVKKAMRDFRRLGGKHSKINDLKLEEIHKVRDIQIKSMKAAISGLEEHAKTHEHQEYIYAVIMEYERMLQRLKNTRDRDNTDLEEQLDQLRLKVLDAERLELRRMYEAGEISASQEKELRRFTNNIESIVLYEHSE